MPPRPTPTTTTTTTSDTTTTTTTATTTTVTTSLDPTSSSTSTPAPTNGPSPGPGGISTSTAILVVGIIGGVILLAIIGIYLFRACTKPSKKFRDRLPNKFQPAAPAPGSQAVNVVYAYPEQQTATYYEQNYSDPNGPYNPPYNQGYDPNYAYDPNYDPNYADPNYASYNYSSNTQVIENSHMLSKVPDEERIPKIPPANSPK